MSAKRGPSYSDWQTALREDLASIQDVPTPPRGAKSLREWSVVFGKSESQTLRDLRALVAAGKWERFPWPVRSVSGYVKPGVLWARKGKARG